MKNPYSILLIFALASTISAYKNLSFEQLTKTNITSCKIITRETTNIHTLKTTADSVINGYQILEYTLPTKFITELLKEKGNIDTIKNGPLSGHACFADWGYILINNNYKIEIACGFNVFEKYISLLFKYSSYSVQINYSLKNIGSYLSDIHLVDKTTENEYDSLLLLNKDSH